MYTSSILENALIQIGGLKDSLSKAITRVARSHNKIFDSETDLDKMVDWFELPDRWKKEGINLWCDLCTFAAQEALSLRRRDIRI